MNPVDFPEINDPECKNPGPKDQVFNVKINRGEVKEKRFQLVEPEGRVLESPGASLRFIKKRFRAGEK